MLEVLRKELPSLPDIRFDNDDDDDDDGGGDRRGGGGGGDGGGGNGDSDEEEEQGIIGARARRHRKKQTQVQQLRHRERRQGEPQDEGGPLLNKKKQNFLRPDSETVSSNYTDRSLERNKGPALGGSCSHGGEDDEDEDAVVESEQRAATEAVADEVMPHQPGAARHAPFPGLGRAIHVSARGGSLPPAAAQGGPVRTGNEMDAAYGGGDVGDHGPRVQNFLLGNAGAAGTASGALAAPLQRSFAVGSQPELETGADAHPQRAHVAGGAGLSRRPRAAAADDDAVHRNGKHRRVAHGTSSDAEGGDDMDHEAGDEPAPVYDDMDACDAVGAAAASNAADKLTRKAARHRARALKKEELLAEAAASGSGALVALLQQAQALPWADFDNSRCKQEAGKLLLRFGQQPAVVGDTLPEPDDTPDAPAATSHSMLRLRTSDDVRAGVALLLLLAHRLPEEQVKTQVVRRLACVTGPRVLVDFRLSCTTARVYVMSGLCRLLQHMAMRDYSLESVASGLSSFIGVLVSEYEALQKWRLKWRLTSGVRRAAETIGSLYLPEATNKTMIDQRWDAVEQRLVEDRHLLQYALLYATHATDKYRKVADSPSSLLNIELVATLLDPRACAVENDVRDAALKFVNAAAVCIVDAGSEPPISMEMDDDMFSKRDEERRLWRAKAAAMKAHAEKFCAGVLPPLLALMEAYLPFRALPTPVGAPPPPSLPADPRFALAENMQCVFAAVLAAGLRSKALTWPQVERNLLLPHAPAVFWQRAGEFPRAIAAQLLAHVLRKAPDGVHTAEDAAGLLRAWVITLADTDRSDSMRSRVIAYKVTRALQRCSLTNPLLLHAGIMKWGDKERDEWALHRVAAVDSVAAAAAAGQLPAALREAVPKWAGALIDTVEKRCVSRLRRAHHIASHARRAVFGYVWRLNLPRPCRTETRIGARTPT
jgi:hypothetical protein